MRIELKRVKLTDRFVKSATTDGRKSPIFMDDEVIGFGVQVRETGRERFTLDYIFEGRRPSSAAVIDLAPRARRIDRRRSIRLCACPSYRAPMVAVPFSASLEVLTTPKPEMAVSAVLKEIGRASCRFDRGRRLWARAFEAVASVISLGPRPEFLPPERLIKARATENADD